MRKAMMNTAVPTTRVTLVLNCMVPAFCARGVCRAGRYVGTAPPVNAPGRRVSPARCAR